MKQSIFSVILTAALTSFGTYYALEHYSQNKKIVAKNTVEQLPVNYVNFDNNRKLQAPPADFTNAAASSVKAVVHIKTTINSKTILARDPWAELFGENAIRRYQTPEQMGSGSGVVISPDGYIITNNHVVSGADIVTVTFNDRNTAQAKVVGTDPSMDLAVLKIQEQNLPYMEFGNSDQVLLGEWVLAVGYPLSLDATVTAGIVSAKGRSIGINSKKSNSAIESFIQTDAAVNPGNSGGPLVNTSGQLIGINSAIASPTGSYAGYSYAIPANLVKKAAADIIQYGSVQRGFLGIEPRDLKNTRTEDIKKVGLDEVEGVYIAGVSESGGAKSAGLLVGDFITAINDVPVASIPQLNEQVARYKPGDHVSVTILRGNNTFKKNVELKNIEGNTSIIKQDSKTSLLGAQLRPINSNEAQRFNIKNGVVLLNSGNSLFAKANVQNGFIITGVNGQLVRSLSEIEKIANNNDLIQIEGFYPNKSGRYYYNIQTR
jgi:serine protease Do